MFGKPTILKLNTCRIYHHIYTPENNNNNKIKFQKRNKKMAIFSLFLFPSPPSLFIMALSIIILLSLTISGYTEMNGKQKQYAKFFDTISSKKEENNKLLSRNGMLVFYTPSFIVCLAALTILPHQDLRVIMVEYVLTLHFFKRILEVLFVHKFSGFMTVDAAITIGVSYCVSTATMIYAQYLSQELPEPSVDLKYVGLVVFLIGITGNFYHHYILSNLRKRGDKEYKIPKGGLFDLIICAHYFFEVVTFIGVLCISQTTFTLCFTLGTIFLLMGRSHATREWYISKFGEKFRKDIKAIIPYLF
ncbi:putative 3-oxo-5-alpha-steroid 4-dehydrogenase (NADP(+)) [Helianthus annuus]|uniref:3-oxo-5-alpha-steroid 4-dehydrogenase (NADP(+)) n=2 Tax=Helianthus annuus TaxID=4232 RepID=A0A251SP93_HELAN|nr:putative 3-oxo-5-alpha-steroid 4-dehydrogenase (NADP(+)) [Helianthus annuus]KAJ0486986.1 putative 3-oxo-5-alpha-steroid 4-dehydrogenase (NADP(+)) [Helianthus annuus]